MRTVNRYTFRIGYAQYTDTRDWCFADNLVDFMQIIARRFPTLVRLEIVSVTQETI